MIIRPFSWLLLVALLATLSAGCSPDTPDDRAQDERSEQPNIIYILADDLGYGELGVYGQEKIETPNIDALARSGMKFTNHYSGAPVCAPARYMLMTGKHPGNAYIRSNSETVPRERAHDLEAILENPEWEGQEPIPAATVTVGEVLQRAGYRTGVVGKWGLGGPETEGHPNKQGFDFFHGYLCQRQAHNYFPTHLWRNEERIMLDNDMVVAHQDLPEDADPYDPASYALYHDQPDYSAELMHEEALTFIQDNHSDPFFLYLASPIPHVSLQAPQRWVDYYRDKFGDEEPYVEGSYVPVRYPKATYAAMISYLDEQVGEIVDKLKELGVYDNTLIIFTSDNGPTFNGGVDAAYFDSAAPFKNEEGWTKASLREGGIRVPMIASWEGVIPPGSTTDHLSAFWDVMPTLSELAGVAPPDDMDGISFLPTLMGNEDEQERHDYLYWEYPTRGGQQAVRMDNWKATRMNIFRDDLEIELYNLEDDIQEQNNVADQHPDVVAEMERIMARAHTVPELEQFEMPALMTVDISATSPSSD